MIVDYVDRGLTIVPIVAIMTSNEEAMLNQSLAFAYFEFVKLVSILN